MDGVEELYRELTGNGIGQGKESTKECGECALSSWIPLFGLIVVESASGLYHVSP